VALRYSSGGPFERIHYADTLSYPMTMLMWVRPPGSGVGWDAIGGWNGSGGTDTHQLIFQTNGPGSRIEYYVEGISGGDELIDDTNYVGGNWYCCIGVSASASSHAFYIYDATADRSASDTSSTNLGSTSELNNFSAFNTFWVGWAGEWSGLDIAEIAYWGAVLSPAEISMLQAGISPRLVAPTDLALYSPFLAYGERDFIGGNTPTIVGTFSKQAHPPGIIYPCDGDEGVGGEGTRTLYEWDMHHANVPATNAAVPSFRNNHLVYNFDSTTQQTLYLPGVMPRGATLGSLGVKLTWTAGVATGNVLWVGSFERHEDNAFDLDADGFGDLLSRDATAPGSIGLTKTAYIRFSSGSNIDSIAAGESFRLRISRDAPSDGMSGNAQLKNVELVEV
jgi:hypothetical protein